MASLSRSSKIQVAGLAGGIGSFALLVAGLFATGGGHGSYAMWYVGLGAAAVSAVLLIVGTAGAAWSKEKNGLTYGLVAIVTFAVAGIYFFDLSEWLAEVLF